MIFSSFFPVVVLGSFYRFVSSPFCRFKAGGGRGVDVSAGPAGPVPEDAGNWPGVCSGQEGGAGPVSWFFWSLGTFVTWCCAFRVLIRVFGLPAGGITLSRTRSPHCRARPRTEPTPTAVRSRPICRCFWRQLVAFTHRWESGDLYEGVFHHGN